MGLSNRLGSSGSGAVASVGWVGTSGTMCGSTTVLGWGNLSGSSVKAPGFPAEESMRGGGTYPVGLVCSSTAGRGAA